VRVLIRVARRGWDEKGVRGSIYLGLGNFFFGLRPLGALRGVRLLEYLCERRKTEAAFVAQLFGLECAHSLEM